jgi:hypothetical protein
VPEREPGASDACARCGLPALGYATIGDQRVCHSDEERPSCYELGLWDQAAARLAVGADERRKTPGVLDSIEDLIERSSLGTPEAKALREQADPALVERVMERVRELTEPTQAGTSE